MTRSDRRMKRSLISRGTSRCVFVTVPPMNCPWIWTTGRFILWLDVGVLKETSERRRVQFQMKWWSFCLSAGVWGSRCVCEWRGEASACVCRRRCRWTAQTHTATHTIKHTDEHTATAASQRLPGNKTKSIRKFFCLNKIHFNWDIKSQTFFVSPSIKITKLKLK